MNNPNDTDLREALRRREAKRPRVDVPADFLGSVMQQIADTPAAKPVAKSATKVWRMAMTVLATAASIAIVVLLVMPHDAQQGASPTGQVAVLLPTNSATMTFVAQTATPIPAGKPAIPTRKSKTPIRKSQTKTDATDSLDYYISAVERKLAEIQDSCYEARVERLIRADDRLQRLVGRLVLNGILCDTLRATALTE